MHKVKNFDHPKVPLHHQLKAHVLYEITSSSFNLLIKVKILNY